jgi:hypothetical protein
MRDKLPKSLNFGNCGGVEYPDYFSKNNDNHDSVYSPGDNDQSFHASSESYDSEGSDANDDQPNDIQPADITGVGNRNLGKDKNNNDEVRS